MSHGQTIPIHKSLRYLTLLSIFILAVSTGNAQHYISGKILTTGGQPLAGTTVKVSDVNTTKTDQLGHFKLLCIPGDHLVHFEHVGYTSLQKKLRTGETYYTIRLKSDSISLHSVQVYGYTDPITPTIDQLKVTHRNIAGGTSITQLDPSVQRLETLKDALKYEPGLIIQEFFGANDQPRLSIRGSGIQSNPQRRGLYLLQDGIPVNFADGSFIISVMDPAISESIEVFKGANALRYGAATLGGAINFNSRNGKNNAGLQLKTEGGSFGYIQTNLMMGTNWKKTDAFLSLSASRQDGFRQHNRNKKMNIATNWGYRISNTIDSRIYLNYAYINFDVPGPLTLAMLREDPTQVNTGVHLPDHMGPDIARDQPGREATVLRIANRSSFRLSTSSRLTASLYYQRIDDRFAFPIVLSTQRSTGHDAGISIQAERYFDHATFTTGALASLGNIDRRGHINKNGLDSYLFSKDNLNALNLTWYAEYQHRFNDRLHLIGNIQAVKNQRNSEDVFPNPELRPWYSHSSNKYRYFHSYSQSMDQDFSSFNPRLGFIYNLKKNSDFQFFGNISRSYEPPTFDELVGTKVTDNINTSPKEFFAVRLDKQSATTFELGSRQESKRYGWNISIYRSWVKNELLEVKDFVLGVKQTKNYPHTIHQGIESAFFAQPFQGILSSNDEISLQAMYTYSDFYFQAGDYKGQKIAGVPPHYLTASVTYKNPGRYFVAFNIESQPEKSPIDHTNTVYQPAFTLYGLRAGFDIGKRFNCYIEGKNVFNKRYASSYIISDQLLVPPMPFPNFGIDNIAFFIPGQPRSIYVGLTYKIKSIQSH